MNRISAAQPDFCRLSRLEPGRVCIIKPSALGDVVQSLPVLTALAQRWPQAQFDWVINHELAGLLENHPRLAHLHLFDRRAKGLSAAASFLRLARALYRRRYDLVIDLQGLLRSGLLAWATRARHRVGFANAREGAAWAYTDCVPIPDDGANAVLRYWQIAQALGCVGVPPPAIFPDQSQTHAWAAGVLREAPGPVLAVQAGAQWETKRWPVSHFVALLARQQQTLGGTLVFLGGPGERDLAEKIITGLAESGSQWGDLPHSAGTHSARPAKTKVLNLAGQTSLPQLTAILKRVDLLLSGDTGPMHLAAAVSTPVVALYTCTSPVRAGPYGMGHAVIGTQVGCAASYLKKCGNMICRQDLTPARVWPVLSQALETACTRQQRTAERQPECA